MNAISSAATLVTPIRPGALWKKILHFTLVALISVILRAAPADPIEPSQEESLPYQNGEIVPLIVIDEVPLSDAIRNVARQMNLNFILDPCVPGASSAASGRRVREPEVKIRLEDQTVHYTLNLILKTYGLTLISNPVTTVARIVPKDHRIEPVAASWVLSETKPVIPVINLEKGSLRDAIYTLTQITGLKAVFDPTFSKSRYGRDTAQLSVRWTNLTARQALAALLDNYDLTLVENTNDRSALITVKPAEPGKHGKKRGL